MTGFNAPTLSPADVNFNVNVPSTLQRAFAPPRPPLNASAPSMTAHATIVFWGMAGLLTCAMFPRILLTVMPVFGTAAAAAAAAAAGVDLSWHAPANDSVSSLASAINGTGVYGFVFNTSQTPPSTPYATYNWCNMPHVRAAEYPRAPADVALAYVELIQRHHKRTPYAANTFPVESYPWSCADAGLFFFGAPLNPAGNASAQAYWRVDADAASNPFAAPGFPGDCEFPQLTRGGLDDAWLHGRDLAGVYRDLLHLIPDGDGGGALPQGVSFRVTNNVITSQVAGMVVNGMFGTTGAVPLAVQPDAVDSLEPTYACAAADALAAQYGVGSTDATWTAHLRDSAGLFAQLDALSGVAPGAADWHQSWDHYFDNLSARLCHAKPLPCSVNDTARCVAPSMADEVFRLGEWEYSWMYRGAPQSLAASTAGFGVWVAELASNLRAAREGDARVGVYRHNVAHDGSIARLLSILQIDRMVWPGMGSEVVFELYKKNGGKDGWFVRILWGGRVLTSSSPTIGRADLVPLDTLLAYFDGLVGQHASLIPGKCASS